MRQPSIIATHVKSLFIAQGLDVCPHTTVQNWKDDDNLYLAQLSAKDEIFSAEHLQSIAIVRPISGDHLTRFRLVKRDRQLRLW